MSGIWETFVERIIFLSKLGGQTGEKAGREHFWNMCLGPGARRGRGRLLEELQEGRVASEHSFPPRLSMHSFPFLH